MPEWDQLVWYLSLIMYHRSFLRSPKKISERFSEIPYSTHGRWQEFLSFLSSCALSIKTLGPKSVQVCVYFNKWGWYRPLESDSFPAVLPCKCTLLELFCSIKHFKKTICVWVCVMMNTDKNVFVKTERHNYRLADSYSMSTSRSFFLSHVQTHNLAT